MGASGKEFLQFRMDMQDYEDLEHELRAKIEPLKIEVEDVDYSHDAVWRDLKSKSIKAYKDLKNREYDLRHNKQF